MIGFAGNITRCVEPLTAPGRNWRVLARVLIGQRILCTSLLCGALWLQVSTAWAQSPLAGNFATSSKEIGTSWWSRRDNLMGNQPPAKLTIEARPVTSASTVDSQLLFPESLLSVLQSKYAAWESRLEDSERPIAVNGRLVYPLLQVNYAGWRLPISLYTPPLRGSDARR